MKCSKCGRDNLPTASTCAACGTPLAAAPRPPGVAPAPPRPAAPAAPRPPVAPVAAPRPAAPAPAAPAAAPAPAAPLKCTNCGAAIPPGFKFCGACGTPLAAARPAAPAPPVAPMAPRPGMAPVAPVAPRVNTIRARVVILAPDGKVLASHPLAAEETTLGSAGTIRLADPHAAPIQARLVQRDAATIFVPEPGIPNGTFLLLREAVELKDGMELRVGRQLLKVRPAAPVTSLGGADPVWGSPNPRARWSMVQLLQGGVEGDVFPLRPGENLVGRTAGDLSFVGDGYVSSRHAVLASNDQGVTVRDIGSSNGTYVRLDQERPLRTGDLLLIGDQLLRLDPP